MELHIPAWALYAGGLIYGVSFVLDKIHKSLYPQLQQQAQDFAALKATVVAGHQANEDRINNLAATTRATNYTVAQLAAAIPAPVPVDLNKTAVIAVLPQAPLVAEPVPATEDNTPQGAD